MVYSAGDSGGMGSIPGSRRSPREVNGHPLLYSCLGNSVGRSVGALQSMGSQSWWRLGNEVRANLCPSFLGSRVRGPAWLSRLVS